MKGPTPIPQQWRTNKRESEWMFSPHLLSVLWHCWLGVKKDMWPIKRLITKGSFPQQLNWRNSKGAGWPRFTRKMTLNCTWQRCFFTSQSAIVCLHLLGILFILVSLQSISSAVSCAAKKCVTINFSVCTPTLPAILLHCSPNYIICFVFYSLILLITWTVCSLI